MGTGTGAIGIQGPYITALALSTQEHISCGFLVTIVLLPVAGTRTPRYTRVRGARSLKFWPHNSPLKSTKLAARIRCISKVLAHANFEAVLCETAARQRRGRQRKKKKRNS